MTQAFTIKNLGLTVPNQSRPQGPYTSVGASFGYGDRSDPCEGISDPRLATRSEVNGIPKRPLKVVPGVGEYNMRKDADDNINPKYG